jgi:rhodanese-related sulfurtransferase
MDWIINGLIIILLVWFLVGRILPAKGVKQMTTGELRKIAGDKTRQFIDVRTPGEYSGNHIKGFKNIPVHELRGRINELSKEKEVVVICQSGMRSNKASKILAQKGFTEVTNVQGGMSSWRG